MGAVAGGKKVLSEAFWFELPCDILTVALVRKRCVCVGEV